MREALIHGHFGSEITERRLQQQSQAVGTPRENSPGVVCLLVPWSQISDPPLDSDVTPAPPKLSPYSSLPLRALCPYTVCLPDYLSLLRPLLLHLSVCFFFFCSPQPLCLHSWLSHFLFLLLSFHLCHVCLSQSYCLHLAIDQVNRSFPWKPVTLKITHENLQS